MKIFVAIFEDYAYNDGNPFVWTIEKVILERHNNIVFNSQKELFWTEDDWDIVHVMWPDCFVPAMREGKNLYERLSYLKQRGTKVISTIHNFWSHSHSSEEDYFFAYQIVYSLSDVMIHLGNYSKERLEGIYPHTEHIIIPHHVYDQKYSSLPSKNDALRRLGYSEGIYVLVFGAFRHSEEKQLMFRVIKDNPHIKFIIPRLYEIPNRPVNIRWFKRRIKRLYYRFVYPNLYCKGESFVSEENLLYYYAASEISFLPRMANLNSGNLPLGMLMQHVIVGPNIGNIGELIRSTHNFTYKFEDYESINKALNEAVAAVGHGKGVKNREYAIMHWNTEKMSDSYYRIYKTLCNH